MHLPSMGLLLVGGLGSLISLCAGGFLLVYGLTSLAQDPNSASPIFSLAWLAGLVFLLVIPSIILAARRLAGKSEPGWKGKSRYRIASILMVAWFPLILIGNLLSSHPGVSWLALQPVQIFAIAVPIWFFLETGLRGLPEIGLQRGWGIFDFTLLVTIPIILVIEVIVLLLTAGVGITFLAGNKPVLNDLTQAGMRLANSNFNPEVVDRILRYYLRQPGILIFILSMAAGVIPLVEELLKPLGLWYFWRKGISPAQGYKLGLLAGCAFAFLESTGAILTNTGEGWLPLVIGRAGTGILHMLTSGLLGWGMANSWKTEKYFKLALAYFTAVCIHGIWNLFSFLMGTYPYIDPSSHFYLPGQFSPVILFLLVLLMFKLLTVAPRLIGRENSLEMTNALPENS
jgi:hypothetical protein